tara:strand:+ start:371 stop:1174 length:804 start_codon:yes stop_codon:yes gene_type:complete
MIRFVVLISALITCSLPALADDIVTIYAAGSLKAALGEVVASYEEKYNIKVVERYGPSGLLREAIESNETPDIFASANMKHPYTLELKHWGSPVVMFARNKLCALAQQDVDITSDTLLDVLLNDTVRVGTSTPKADPSGDYAWELFKKADNLVEGSFSILAGKALQLTGGKNSNPAPNGRNQYGWVLSENKADVFLTYCTNAVLARKEFPTLKIIKVTENLSVGADYGLLVRAGASKEAWQLGMYILSPAGQKILADYGFDAGGMSR